MSSVFSMSVFLHKSPFSASNGVICKKNHALNTSCRSRMSLILEVPCDYFGKLAFHLTINLAIFGGADTKQCI